MRAGVQIGTGCRLRPQGAESQIGSHVFLFDTAMLVSGQTPFYKRQDTPGLTDTFMDITCPNCATLFSVPEGAIGPNGRRLKCSQCGHLWRQMPPSAAPVQAPAESAPVVEPPAPPPPDPLPPEPLPPVSDLPMEAEPPPSPDDDTEVDIDPVASDIIGDIGEDPDFDPMGPVDAASAHDAEDDDALARLDPLEADDSDTPRRGDDALEEFSGLVSRDDDAIPDFPDFPDGDDIASPFVRKKASGGGWIRTLFSSLLFLIIVVGVMAGAAWFWRVPIVKTYEDAEALFRMVGIEIDIPGLGLTFREVTGERVLHGGVDNLVVRGFVANTSSTSRPVPFIRLVLFDGTGRVVQELAAQAPVTELAAGDTTGFRVQLQNPSAAARRFEVEWARGRMPSSSSGVGDTAPSGASVP